MATKFIGQAQSSNRQSPFSGYLKERSLQKNQALLDAKQLVAQAEIQKASKTRDYVTTAYQNYWELEESKRQLFDQTDQGKEFKKLVKSYLPEVLDSSGKFIPMPKGEKEGLSPEQDLRMKKALIKYRNDVEKGSVSMGSIANAMAAVDTGMVNGSIKPEVGQMLTKKLASDLAKQLGVDISQLPPIEEVAKKPNGLMTWFKSVMSKFGNKPQSQGSPLSQGLEQPTQGGDTSEPDWFLK